jgi:hypothetical protein
MRLTVACATLAVVASGAPTASAREASSGDACSCSGPAPISAWFSSWTKMATRAKTRIFTAFLNIEKVIKTKLKGW